MVKNEEKIALAGRVTISVLVILVKYLDEIL